MIPSIFIELTFWGVLLAIGVSDAQRHRIPNTMVIMLLSVTCLFLILYGRDEWSDHLLGGLIAFVVSLFLYWKRAMAAGDVKLLFVVGLWIGLDKLSGAAMSIILAGGVISCFYLAIYLAQTGVSFQHNLRSYYYQRVSFRFQHKTKLVIPFAPAVVIGLASYNYFY
ncbi:prepilin peptidase [Vibrio ponticus]|uniref:Prepilin peptidase n=1 Tax=Vibrio ponticus TaxID=265668 RepID=A0A3N3E070_9VIBR|nr:A24 family peptidase [Vibrio ponticus]ROV60147.1 prepilin peptidase [Vibrio ponticus]ROV61452.1 prepilin peptidase [Vibrio ponticus]